MLTKILPVLLCCLLILTTTGCKELAKVIDLDDNKKACVTGVWPAVQASDKNKTFKMTQAQAYRFVLNTRSEVDKEFRGKYRSFTLKTNKVPSVCKQYLWTSSISPSKYRSQCMAAWAKVSKPSSCHYRNTYVVGATIVNGKATVQVVKLNTPSKAAHKKIRTATGSDQNILAKNLGKKIRRELKTHLR